MKERQHELSIEGNSAEIYGTFVNFKNLDMKAGSFFETLGFGVAFEKPKSNLKGARPT